MDVFEFAITEILDCKIVHIPCIFDRRDISRVREYTRKLECRVAIGCTYFEDMLGILLPDEFFEELGILFGDIGDTMFQSDFFEIAECESDDLGH